MPFTNPLVTVPGGRIAKASLSYRRNKRAKVKGMPNLVIGIPKDIAAGLVKSGDAFTMLLGDGADKGKAHLVRTDRDDGAVATVLRGSVVLRFGHVPMLGSDAAEKEAIELQPLDGGFGFELELPKWFAGRI